MGFADAVTTCFRRYTDFSGRATRAEFWWFVLFFVAGRTVTGLMDDVLGHGPVLGWAFVGACLCPLVAAAIRRMHDAGRSGAWIWLGAGAQALLLAAPGAPALPAMVSILAGLLAMVVLATLLAGRGDPAPNRFGAPARALSPPPS